MTIVNIEDLRRLARRRLPRVLFDFMDGGSGDEVTLRANRSDFERIRFRPKVLVDVSRCSLATDVFGVTQALPIALGPVGSVGLFARRGAIQAARAAERCGIPFCLSTVAQSSLEEVRAATSKPFWFQLYLGKDRELARSLIDRAQAARCPVLLFTVDLPVIGRRDRDLRNGFGFPPSVKFSHALDALRHLPWVYDVLLMGPPLNARPRTAAGSTGDRPLTLPELMQRTHDPSKTCKEMDWLRSLWKGPLVIKGILTPDDARLAVEHGADGIVVSNHGAFFLEGAPSTISVLPAIVEAVGGRAKVFLDGGIRRGQDVLKALALGADACLVGRAYAYGLAARGEAGVECAIRILEAEMSATLGFLGRASIAEIDRSMVM
jgi:L-lactate dehydrogenase (cytochrome)